VKLRPRPFSTGERSPHLKSRGEKERKTILLPCGALPEKEGEAHRKTIASGSRGVVRRLCVLRKKKTDVFSACRRGGKRKRREIRLASSPSQGEGSSAASILSFERKRKEKAWRCKREVCTTNKVRAFPLDDSPTGK